MCFILILFDTFSIPKTNLRIFTQISTCHHADIYGHNFDVKTLAMVFYPMMLSEPANHILFNTTSTSVYNFYPGLTMTNLQLCQKSLPIAIECHTQYNVSKCLQMLSIVQLLHFEVHNPGMLARCDMLFQLMFSDLSGALVNNGTTTTCNLIDVILGVKSLQLIDLVWLIETTENLKHTNVFYTTFHSNTIFMTFLNFLLDEIVIYHGNTE